MAEPHAPRGQLRVLWKLGLALPVSHCIEHIANPLKAISEWKRILKDNGLILLIVPHKDKTFDHNRPITSLSHLIEDMKTDVQEDDSTHLPEILELIAPFDLR